MSLEDLLQKREHKDYSQITTSDFEKVYEELYLKHKMLSYQHDVITREIETLKLIMKEWKKETK